MTPERDSLRGRLREDTAASHEALENDLGWERRIASLEGYRRLLGRFHGFHAMVEPAIGDALDDDAFFGPRRRLLSLKADLRHLGLSPEGIGALPPAPSLVLSGAAEALGALYVLEGSTLGGKLIARRVLALHGFDASAGCAYYSGHGERAGSMWRTFCARLDATPEADAAATVSAANATFEAMRVWLCAPDQDVRPA